MIRVYIVALTMLGIAACAAPGPELSEYGRTADDPVTADDSTVAANEVEITDIPPVPETASVPAKNDVVCRMERRTGTHRAERVCRRRTPSAKASAENKESMKTLRKIMVEEPLRP